MNWQLISFFGDSTVLLPSAAALFIVLMLRKTSRLLAWQWSLLFGITGAIVCASKLAFMGWGWVFASWITPASAATQRFPRPSGLSSCGCLVLVFPRVCKSSRRHRLYSGRCGGYSRLVIHAHSVSEVIAGLLLGAVGSALFLLLQNVPPIRKTCVFPGRRVPGDGPAHPVA